jgi:hypothetical protein
MSELTEGQKQAVRDAYTTLRSIRQTATGALYKPMREMVATSEYLLVAEFPEVKDLESALNKEPVKP